MKRKNVVSLLASYPWLEEVIGDSSIYRSLKNPDQEMKRKILINWIMSNVNYIAPRPLDSLCLNIEPSSFNYNVTHHNFGKLGSRTLRSGLTINLVYRFGKDNSIQQVEMVCNETIAGEARSVSSMM